MICQRARAILPDHLAGCLRGRLRREMEQHLQECSGCQAEAEIHQRVVALLRSYPSVDPPATLWNGVRQRIRQPEPRGHVWRRWFQVTFSKPLNVASGIAVTAALVAVLASPGPRGPEGWQRPDPLPEAASASGYLHQQALIDARDPLADRVALGPVMTMAVRQNRAYDRALGDSP